MLVPRFFRFCFLSALATSVFFADSLFGLQVTAEAELLSAIVGFFERVGLTAKDVGLKVNSRKVLQAVLEPLGVTEKLFAPVCVIVDKLDKLPAEAVQEQLTKLGLPMEVITKIQQTLSIKSLDGLNEVLGADSPIVKELRNFWTLCEGYGIADWITFDASVVRGLAYYTGIVFEGFDRPGKFRAICGGGRYDRLFTTYGAPQPISACGFGFGDCVIVEVLKDKGLIPALEPEVEFIVTPFDETLRPVACEIAKKIRALPGNPRVDLQLMPGKKLPWCYSYADRVGAKKLILIAPDEWAKGCIRVKNLRAAEGDSNKEYDLAVSDLNKLVQ
jgi:histidyl-tRNA synthetase